MAPDEDEGWVLALRGGSSTASFVVEPRMSLTPRDIETSLASPSFRRLRARSGQSLIVIAPYLSPRSRELLAREDISYLDLTGNVRILSEYPAVWIQQEGARNDPTAKQRPSRGVRGAAAGKLVRVLVDVRPPYGVTELSQVARVDAGYASRVLETLEAEALVDRGRRGRVIDTDWELLLRQRARAVDLLNPRESISYVAPDDAMATFARLDRLAQQEAVVTGSLAASRIAPVAAPVLLALYTLRDRDEIAERLNLLPVSEGANVVLIRPQNTGPFFNAVPSPPVMFAAPSQTVIDCLSGNGRMPAEGEAVLEWMRQDQNAWRAESLDAATWPPWVQR
ncbi:MAG TPA: hypothetical protein VG318_01030 [Actinomycetota bacterium]|nr:hypothetical protein [Actinomycetota bacterium]